MAKLDPKSLFPGIFGFGAAGAISLVASTLFLSRQK